MVKGQTIKEYENSQEISEETANNKVALMVQSNIYGVAATTTIPMFTANVNCLIVAVRIGTDTEIADGDATDNWSFQFKNLTQDKAVGVAQTTNGVGKGVAQYGIKRCVVSEVYTTDEPSGVDVYGLVITKNGTPTDLSSAKLLIVMSYTDNQ